MCVTGTISRGKNNSTLRNGNAYINRDGKRDWNIREKLREEGCGAQRDRKRDGQGWEEYLECSFRLLLRSPLKGQEETAKILLDGRDVRSSYDERLSWRWASAFMKEPRMYTISLSVPSGSCSLIPQSMKADGGAESLRRNSLPGPNIFSRCHIPWSRRDKDVLIVGHGAMNSAIVCHVKHNPLTSSGKRIRNRLLTIILPTVKKLRTLSRVFNTLQAQLHYKKSPEMIFLNQMMLAPKNMSQKERPTLEGWPQYGDNRNRKMSLLILEV